MEIWLNSEDIENFNFKKLQLYSNIESQRLFANIFLKFCFRWTGAKKRRTIFWIISKDRLIAARMLKF